MAYTETFKAKQRPTTTESRRRIIKNHIIPAIGNMRISEITTTVLQKWFDGLCEAGYAKETLLKIKNTANPVFRYAVEEGIIPKNPFKSQHFKINTEKADHLKAIPEEAFKQLKDKLPALKYDRDRKLGALLCYTGMRPEEARGLKWEDIQDGYIFIQRAVTYPHNNKPSIGPPKTKTSTRPIPAVAKLIALLQPIQASGYIISHDNDGKEPISYQQYRDSCSRIFQSIGLTGYAGRDFRSTCATTWFENNMPMKDVSKLLGHAKQETTERCYVKYRRQSMEKARAMLEIIS